MLLAFSRERPELLLNILQCEGQVPTTKRYLAPNVKLSTEAEKLCVREEMAEMGVLIFLGHCNRIPEIGWLDQQTFIF